MLGRCMRHPSNPRAQLKAAHRLVAVAPSLLLLGMWIMFEDLRSSNRPHELRGAPLVTGIMLANTFVCCRLTMRLRRALRGLEAVWVRHYLLLTFAALLWGLALLVLVSAASTVPAVLGW